MKSTADFRFSTSPRPNRTGPRLGWLTRGLLRLAPLRTVGPGGLHGRPLKRALVVQLDGEVASILRTTPLIVEFESRFPGISIDLVVASRAAESVFRHFSSIGQMILAAGDSRNAFAWLAAILRCRRSHYDLVIDLGASNGPGNLVMALTRADHFLAIPAEDDPRWSCAMFAAPLDPARLPVFLLRRALVCEEQRDEVRFPPLSLRLAPAEIRDAQQTVAALSRRDRSSVARVIGVVGNRSTKEAFPTAWWKQLVEELRRLEPDVILIDIESQCGRWSIDQLGVRRDSADVRTMIAVLSQLQGVIVVGDSECVVVAASGTPFLRLYADAYDRVPANPGSPALSIAARTTRQIAATLLRLFNPAVQAGISKAAVMLHDARSEQLPGTRTAVDVRLVRGRVRPGGPHPMRLRAAVVAAMLAVVLACCPVAARAGGPLGVDHVVAYDNSGIWKRSYQTTLAVGTVALVAGSALWLGDDDTLGDTLWRSVDAMAFTAVTTAAMKFSFSRERPSQTSNPDRFFAGHGNQSFPSGEVAELSAAVTPLIMTYGPDHPGVYALALLPLYDAIARVKVHGHWQSDVLVGAAVGAGLGYYATQREHALVVGWLPGGLQVGFSKSFR